MIVDKNVYLTKEGLRALKKELQDLQDKKRPRVVKRVAEARSMGDLTENAEYTSAREELSIVEGRIEELEKIVSKARIIRPKKKKECREVSLGCKVTVKANGETRDFDVVGEWEADPLNKKISHSSPLGKALLGKRKGDKVEIEAPAGKVIYEVTEID
ncbi:MAG TPA: transcription elongation factor GreA [Candidatus Bathyarchaeia archaeon]|nr:transcription elongation factor GreA [Candidatus Bathyarchaeia archaeon]